MPDTSPRGDSVPNVDAYDLGIGAGFYVDATAEPYRAHYRMYTYVSSELPDFLERHFNIGGNGCRSLCGHSMGGHGALTISLKEPRGSWAAASALAPICNPSDPSCLWGTKAFDAYLVGGIEAGKAHDATELLMGMVANGGGERTPIFDEIMIDYGTKDEFLHYLSPEKFVEAASLCGQKVTCNAREGYDHSYHFVSSFVEDHVKFHGSRLRLRQAMVSAASVAAEDAPATTAGRPIECMAMVARAPKMPLSLETVTVDPPRAGEVRVKVICNALCHTDVYTLDGLDPEG
jgi:S-(hydroxymethyl)glutathione dehydrogenase/alcohol dehydrogenase